MFILKIGILHTYLFQTIFCKGEVSQFTLMIFLEAMSTFIL